MTEHPFTEPCVKRTIYDRQNGLCAYCGQRRQLKRMTVDHIIPLSKGGTNDIDNLQCTCRKCNGLKEDMLPSEFTVFIQNMLENSMRIEKNSAAL